MLLRIKYPPHAGFEVETLQTITASFSFLAMKRCEGDIEALSCGKTVSVWNVLINSGEAQDQDHAGRLILEVSVYVLTLSF